MADWEALWRDALYAPAGSSPVASGPRSTSGRLRWSAPNWLKPCSLGVDLALGKPAALDFVDVGAGGGELAATVRELASDDLARRLRVTAVDLGPARSLPGVRRRSEPPSSVTGLLVGHEWLDAVPCPVVVGPSDDPWLRTWWPPAAGERAEVGAPRDALWVDAVGRVRGAAPAVDHGHLRADRAAGRYPHGILAGYRDGRQVEPVPDGSSQTSPRTWRWTPVRPRRAGTGCSCRSGTRWRRSGSRPRPCRMAIRWRGWTPPRGRAGSPSCAPSGVWATSAGSCTPPRACAPPTWCRHYPPWRP